MEKKDIRIQPEEQRALEMMEHPRKSASLQHEEMGDEEMCRELCAEIAGATIAEMCRENPWEIDTQKELERFHRHRREKVRRRLWLWAGSVAAGIAVVALLAAWLYPHGASLQTIDHERIQVFRADKERQDVMLQPDEGRAASLLSDALAACGAATIRPDGKTLVYHASTTPQPTKSTTTLHTQVHRLSIPRGETFKVILSDGTEVELNADSRLAYPTLFRGKERIVTLEGEAFFRVAKDESRPFIVRSGGIQVRVLGTEFNVRSYSPTDVDVTLIKGKVEVSDTCQLQTVVMQPGESVRHAPDEGFTRCDTDIESFLYKREGYFYFDDMTLEEMMEEIGRWYNIDIFIENSEAARLRMHFFANRHQDIYHLIELLNRTERIHASMEEGQLVIR